MDFEKLAEASHQAWFVAMAKQGWIFGPRLNPDFKTHPWLKPYAGLSDGTKEIVRAQVRGMLAGLEAQGVSSIKGFAGMAPPPSPPAPAPTRPAPAADAPARQAPEPSQAAPAQAAPPSRGAAPAPTPAASQVEAQVLDRKIDASGRMRIGAGLVKKADLLPGGATQVAILQNGNIIEVVPYDAGLPNAFFASVNPDGFMLPKAMLSGMGAVDFILTITPGRLVVKPK